MAETTYRNRRAVQLENDTIRVTILVEGGHIAEILHKKTGVNPLWTPPWPSIEPSVYDPETHPEYGRNAESKLLAGIMGHNLCIDLFGGPSKEEAAAGMTVHGEASIVPYSISEEGNAITARAVLPTSQLEVERRISIVPGCDVMKIVETVSNLSCWDRPIAWTQHVTIGPPYLKKGSTQFRAPGDRSRTHDDDFAPGKSYMKPGVEFQWPMVPTKDGCTADLQIYTNTAVSAGFTTTLMDPCREEAYFLAFSPESKVLFGYIWKQKDFPWLGIWEENYFRTIPPWNGKTLTRGMEFGASPQPETRRQMIERNGMFGVPGYRWIPAKTSVQVHYCAFITTSPAICDSVVWDGEHTVRFQ